MPIDILSYTIVPDFFKVIAGSWGVVTPCLCLVPLFTSGILFLAASLALLGFWFRAYREERNAALVLISCFLAFVLSVTHFLQWFLMLTSSDAVTLLLIGRGVVLAALSAALFLLLRFSLLLRVCALIALSFGIVALVSAYRAAELDILETGLLAAETLFFISASGIAVLIARLMSLKEQLPLRPSPQAPNKTKL
jgi:hypothetical protein